jgi:branched-chain amino acid transport system substrate-binding protein
MKASLPIHLIAALLILCCGVSAVHARQPVRLGFVYILSGAFAAYGENARQGALLAADEINRAGGIDGRLVLTWFENSRSRPNVAIQAMQTLVREKRVDALIGIDSSKVAQQVAAVANDLKTPLIITNAATTAVTGALCNRYVFRVSLNLAQVIKSAALLTADSGAKYWSTVGKKHPYSYESWDYFKNFTQDLDPGINIVADQENVFIPSRQKDFTPYLEKLERTSSDGVLVTLWGGYLRRFIKQADDRGLFTSDRRFLFTMGAALDNLMILGDRMPTGLWVTAPYWYLSPDSNRNRQFVANYQARYQTPPSHQAHGAYAAVYAFKAAAEKAGTTEKESVATALANLTIDLPGGRTTFRVADHQGVTDIWWGRTFDDPAYPMRILRPLKRFRGTAITRPVNTTGCSMH